MRKFLVFFAGLLVAPVVACSDDSNDTPEAEVVTATLAEYSITLGETTVPAGAVTFKVTNSGDMIHEFVVLKTDFNADTLPVDGDGAADEEAEGVTAMGEIEDIEADGTKELDLTLTAGHYLAICNIGDHFSLGMVTAFTVQ